MGSSKKIEGKTADEWLELAKKYLDPSSRIEYFSKVIEIDSTRGVAWYGKASALKELGKYEEAIECYDKAIEIKSDNSLAWKGKGDCFKNLKRYEEAIECYDRAMEIKPGPIIWKDKGDCFKNLKRYEEAIECYDKASAIYCGELLLLNLRIGEVATAYKYAKDLNSYVHGRIKPSVEKLCTHLEYRVHEGIQHVSDEFISNADSIIHNVKFGMDEEVNSLSDKENGG